MLEMNVREHGRGAASGDDGGELGGSATRRIDGAN